MKNILLQHWHTAHLPEIVRLSAQSMREYAAHIGAEWRMMISHPWDKRLTPPCQKCYLLHENLDDFDWVVMVDADMFPRSGLIESIFDDVIGYGIHHPSAHQRVARQLPNLITPTSHFYGGAVYRFPLTIRQLMRAHYRFEEAIQFNERGKGEDESIISRLATLARIPPLYFGQEWAWASYDPHPEKGKFIHVRHHDGKGHRVDKMDVYRDLKSRGIIA